MLRRRKNCGEEVLIRAFGHEIEHTYPQGVSVE